MSKYFIKQENEEQKGPFTIEELKDMNLTDKFSIWTDGFSTWRDINVIKELQDYVVKLPPSKDKYFDKIQELRKKYTMYKYWIAGLSALALFYILGGFASNYELVDDLYPGLGSTLYNEVAIKIRLILIIFSLIISWFIAQFYYNYNMLGVFKKVYEKKEL